MLNYVSFFFLISLDYNNNGSTGYLMRTSPLTAERLNDDSYVVCLVFDKITISESMVNRYFADSQDYSLIYLLREVNIPPQFIVMALPMYGSTFILQNADKRYFGDEYIDIGPPGPGAHIAGILTVSEVSESLCQASSFFLHTYHYGNQVYETKVNYSTRQSNTQYEQ